MCIRDRVSDKAQAIDKLVELQMAGGCIADREAYRKAILAREEMSSTAIEQGIAVPHAKSDAVSAPSLAAMTLTQGVDYGAMDGQPSDLFFMIAATLNGCLLYTSCRVVSTRLTGSSSKEAPSNDCSRCSP